MRIIILAVLFWAHIVLAELAEPPVPVFARAVLVTAQGATPAAAQQQARLQALIQTRARDYAGLNIAVTHQAVVYMQQTATGYQIQMWVAVESVH